VHIGLTQRLDSAVDGHAEEANMARLGEFWGGQAPLAMWAFQRRLENYVLLNKARNVAPDWQTPPAIDHYRGTGTRAVATCLPHVGRGGPNF